jgi:hypothetical protein
VQRSKPATAALRRKAATAALRRKAAAARKRKPARAAPPKACKVRKNAQNAQRASLKAQLAALDEVDVGPMDQWMVPGPTAPPAARAPRGRRPSAVPAAVPAAAAPDLVLLQQGLSALSAEHREALLRAIARGM